MVSTIKMSSLGTVLRDSAPALAHFDGELHPLLSDIYEQGTSPHHGDDSFRRCGPNYEGFIGHQDVPQEERCASDTKVTCPHKMEDDDEEQCLRKNVTGTSTAASAVSRTTSSTWFNSFMKSFIAMSEEQLTFFLTDLKEFTGYVTEYIFAVPQPQLFISPKRLSDPEYESSTFLRIAQKEKERKMRRSRKDALLDPFYPISPPRFISEETGRDEPDVELYIEPRSGDVLVGCGLVEVGEKRRDIRRPPEEHARTGTLAPIVSSFIDYEAVKKMDVENELYIDGVCMLDMLTDVTVFRQMFLEGRTLPTKTPTRISRHMRHHLDDMERYEIIGFDDPHALMPLFCVPKKNGTLRLILDCRWLNALGAAPPPMHLPTIHGVLEYVLQNNWAAQVDNSSWFYQFRLAAAVSRYFGARIAGHRGKTLTDVVFRKMPMGWTWAPAFGQRVSNVLTRGLGMCWVDNTILAAQTREELLVNIQKLSDRFADANVIADMSTLVPARSLEFLGVEVDLEAKRFRMSKSWIEKISEKQVAHCSTLSLRTLYEHLGRFLWSAHVRQIPLCTFPHVVDAMSSAVRGTNLDDGWDQNITLTQEQLRDLQKLEGIVLGNDWTILKTTGSEGACKFEVWSDASSTESAFIIIDRYLNKVIGGDQWKTSPETHIFLKELAVAVSALQWCKDNAIADSAVSMHIDNAAAHHSVRKNHSTVLRANELLAQVSDVPRISTLVGTDAMVADMFTRGERVTEFIGKTPKELWEHAKEWKKRKKEQELEAWRIFSRNEFFSIKRDATDATHQGVPSSNYISGGTGALTAPTRIRVSSMTPV